MGDVRVDRVAVELLRTGCLDDLAAAHHRHQVRQRERLLLVVGDKQGGGAGCSQRRADLAPDLGAEAGIERVEGLVEQDQARVGGQRHPLLLAAGELVGEALVEPLEVDQGQQFLHPAAAALGARQPEADVGGDVEVGEEGALLGDEADRPALRRQVGMAVA